MNEKYKVKAKLVCVLQNFPAELRYIIQKKTIFGC